MAKKEKKEIIEMINIPNGIEVKINNLVEVKGPKGEVKKMLKRQGIIIEQKEGKIVITSKKRSKREKKMIKTLKSHVINMIDGVVSPYIYKLQVCSVHFPMTVNIDKEKGIIKIKNFIGEVKERTAKIIDKVDVKIEKDIITIESCDIEKAGQTAANIENATKIVGRDRRIFQDGIYMINKAGEEI